MLEVRDLTVRYGPIRAVRGVSLGCEAGEVLLIVGPNGAGKSSLLLAIAGACEGVVGGSVRLDDREAAGEAPEKLVGRGMALVPEGRRIFTRLTVEENLRLAVGSVARDRRKASIDEVLQRFPVLAEVLDRHAGLLSGGQQQQLAIARALLTGPRLLLLDEPSLGLSPNLVEEVFSAIAELRAASLAIVLVDQNVRRALEVADRTVVMRNGQIEGSGVRAVDDEMLEAVLGRVTVSVGSS